MSPTPDGRTDPRFARALLQRNDAFLRQDESDDAIFYGKPRLVSHLDSTALNTVERLVSGLIVEDDPVVAVFAEKGGLVQGRGNRLVLRDPARLDTDWAAVQARKGKVGETLECPHCQVKLSKWEVPDDPCIDWPNDYLYLCFNDFCPFVVRGWRHMWNQGILGTSYRYLFNPLKGTSTTVPIRGLTDLRPGIVEEDAAGRFRSAIEKGLPDFSGLPQVKAYGPKLGGPRG